MIVDPSVDPRDANLTSVSVFVFFFFFGGGGSCSQNSRGFVRRMPVVVGVIIVSTVTLRLTAMPFNDPSDCSTGSGFKNGGIEFLLLEDTCVETPVMPSTSISLVTLLKPTAGIGIDCLGISNPSSAADQPLGDLMLAPSVA